MSCSTFVYTSTVRLERAGSGLFWMMVRHSRVCIAVGVHAIRAVVGVCFRKMRSFVARNCRAYRPFFTTCSVLVVLPGSKTLGWGPRTDERHSDGFHFFPSIRLIFFPGGSSQKHVGQFVLVLISRR